MAFNIDFMPANQICELVVPSPCETKPYHSVNNANWNPMWSFTSHHVIRNQEQKFRFQFSSSNILGAWTIDSATSRYQPPSPPPLIILDLPLQILLYICGNYNSLIYQLIYWGHTKHCCHASNGQDKELRQIHNTWTYYQNICQIWLVDNTKQHRSTQRPFFSNAFRHCFRLSGVLLIKPL